MQAAVLYGTGDVRIVEVNDPGAPSQGQVRVRVKAVGVCGSDVHYFAHGRIGHFVVEQPMILGHEAAGIVEAVGEGVTHLQVGDVVALEPGVPCARCEACKAGRYNLCPDVRFFATPPIDGAIAETVLHPASFTYRVPDGMTADTACLAEPVSVAIQAIRKAGDLLGQRVLVIGAGPIGTLTGIVAQAAGATATIVDVSERRLAQAHGLGLAAVTPSGLQNVEFDTVFECSGAKGTIAQSCRACRAGGTVVLVGMHRDELSDLPSFDVIAKELQLRGVFRYANTYPAALQFLDKETQRLQPFLQSFITLAQVAEHFEEAAAGRAEPLKTIVRM
ncbi:MAG: NAD(P)-dependent alcohol dehydrogenase [Firmicutes bacterium]|nr:NAD(P)-dependent alcohol dehydrogenase [Bacillota bacterium]